MPLNALCIGDGIDLVQTLLQELPGARETSVVGAASGDRRTERIGHRSKMFAASRQHQLQRTGSAEPNTNSHRA